MGLDIYAGQLTRYYSRNWRTITQQLAEENGRECVMVDGCGNKIQSVGDNEETTEIREAVIQWAESIANNLHPVEPYPIWDEENEKDYYTDKPDWEAYGALLVLQACQSMNHPLPKYVESGWNAFNETIVKKARVQESPKSMISNACLWLPIPEKSVFVAQMPNGESVTISTVELLKQELEELNRQVWNADEATILSWRNEKYYNPVAQSETKLIFGFIRRTKKMQKERYATEELAQCAYSILYQAVIFAEKHHVPILLDY